MATDLATNAVADGNVEKVSMSERENSVPVNDEKSIRAFEQAGEGSVLNPQSEVAVPETAQEVRVSAHERDREEQASRRIKEAQKYHDRSRGQKGTHRFGRGGFGNKSRFDPSKQEKSDDPAEIRKQVKSPRSQRRTLN